MGRSVLPLAVAIVLSGVLPLLGRGAAEGATAQPSATELAVAKEERAALGLPADDATLKSLIGSTADVGSAEWGIVMTAAEEDSIELPGRMAFAAAVKKDVLPYVKSLPAFAGAYFDSASQGEFVVVLTAPDREVEESIAARMPAPSRGLVFAYNAVTEARLVAALKKTETVWDEVYPDVTLFTAAVDLPNAELYFEVSPDNLMTAQSRAGSLATALLAPVSIRAGPPPMDTTCTRDDCVNPMRAGIRIYKGAIDSVPECTMSFHIQLLSNFDIQFLTAGHCGYSGSNTWLHPGLSGNHVIGTEQATLYANNGYDAMRVSMADAQASTKIVGESRVINGESYPSVGQAVCDSRGNQDVIDCGTVTSTSARWLSNTANYYVYGGLTDGISQIGGDSGSPLYERFTSTTVFADGIVTTSGGNFTIMYDATNGFHANVWQ
jgi:hypothetical protein